MGVSVKSWQKSVLILKASEQPSQQQRYTDSKPQSENDFLLSFLGHTFCFSCLPSPVISCMPNCHLAACNDLPMCRMWSICSMPQCRDVSLLFPTVHSTTSSHSLWNGRLIPVIRLIRFLEEEKLPQGRSLPPIYLRDQKTAAPGPAYG